MKKVLSVLLGRMSLVTVLVVVQAALSALAISYLSTQMLPLHVVLVLFSLLVVFWIGAKEDNPTYKLAWIVPIMLFPLFGGLFYLLWGNKKMPKRDRLRMLGYYRTQPSLFARQDGHEQELARWDPHLARVADYIFRTSGFPLEDSTQADYYPLGDDLFEPMVEDLRRARKFILMEYFIIEPGIMWDTILEVLKERGITFAIRHCAAGLPPGWRCCSSTTTWAACLPSPRSTAASSSRAVSAPGCSTPSGPGSPPRSTTGTTGRSAWWTEMWATAAGSTWRTNTSTGRCASAIGRTRRCGWRGRGSGT